MCSFGSKLNLVRRYSPTLYVELSQMTSVGFLGSDKRQFTKLLPFMKITEKLSPKWLGVQQMPFVHNIMNVFQLFCPMNPFYMTYYDVLSFL